MRQAHTRNFSEARSEGTRGRVYNSAVLVNLSSVLQVRTAQKITVRTGEQRVLSQSALIKHSFVTAKVHAHHLTTLL